MDHLLLVLLLLPWTSGLLTDELRRGKVKTYGRLQSCCTQGMKYIPKSVTCRQFALQVLRTNSRCRQVFIECCEFQLNLVQDQNLILADGSQSGFIPPDSASTVEGTARCETTASADIVLLVDESGSVSPRTFSTITVFLAQIARAFHIGPDRVQIGVVQYSSNPRTVWHLNTHETRHILLRRIYSLRQFGGDSMTGRALNYALHNSFQHHVGMRDNSTKIVVLITDGASQDHTLVPSQHLKDAGVELYTVGVNDATEEEMWSIASDPKKSHVYHVTDSSLLHIVDNLTINICDSVKSSDSVRLVDGTGLCSGRLEVKTNQSDQRWSSVCEADFDQQDAEVVCRQLGCGPPSVLQGALYGEVEAPMWTKEFQCGGHESALLDCRSSDRNSSSPGRAVGLTCSEPVRLVNGSSRCAGTLEVKRGDWKPVAGSDWTLKEAAVVCGEVDCGSAVSTGRTEESSNRSAWTISLDCLQAAHTSGSALRQCVTSASSSSIIEVTCSEPVRLVNGSSRCAGTLEVKRGDWKPVAGSDWTLKEAAVVCGEVDCGSAVSTGRTEESSNRSAWTISSDCLQAAHTSGSALRQCVTSASSSSIMEVTCSDSVRLVDGTGLCSGRLEVKTNQSDQRWSSVCEADFDQQDAEVVCRQLGCGPPSVLQGALYGEVEAPMWTKEFQCGGHESALLDCRSSDRNSSSPGRAVGLTCSEPVRLVNGSSRCAGTLEVRQGDWKPVAGSDWTLKEAAVVCGEVDCGSAVSTGRTEESSNRSAWTISSDCLQAAHTSGSALRQCVTPSSSSSTLELTCSHPADFTIRLIVLPLILLLVFTVIYFISKATGGQKPGPQENIELDYYNLGVCRAERVPAVEEGVQAAEPDYDFLRE